MEGKSEKINAALAAFVLESGPIERHQSRLLGVNLQLVFRESLCQHTLYSPGILLAFEDHHEIVRIPNQFCRRVQSRPYHLVKPLV